MSATAILERVAKGELTADEAAKLLAAESNVTKVAGLKVGDKGGIVIKLNSRRFPVTLYAEEAEAILAASAEITEFVAQNKGKLVRKG